MKIVTAEQVANTLNMKGLINSMRTTYQAPAQIPQRRVMPLSEQGYDAFALLPAWNEELITVKAFTYFPDNPLNGEDSLSSKIMAFDRSNGKPVAMVDGKVLTYWRTAAASALAASYLARENAETLLVCGSGNLAPYIAWAYSAIRPISKVIVWGRDEQKAREVVDRVYSGSEYQALPKERQFIVVATQNLEDAVKEADVISCVTGASQPLFSADLVQQGTHVDLIGNHDQDKRECDSELVLRAHVYVDSRVNVLAEAGELLIPISEGRFSAENIIGELTDLCAGRCNGRSNNSDITLYKSVGSALADLAGVEYLLANHQTDSFITK